MWRRRAPAIPIVKNAGWSAKVLVIISKMEVVVYVMWVTLTTVNKIASNLGEQRCADAEYPMDH
jgi:hypothetical protein